MKNEGNITNITRTPNPIYSGVLPSLSKSYVLELEKYYNQKYGQIVTPIAILKTLSVVSSKFRDNIKIWVLHVAPSRQLKSKTSNEQQFLFSKNRIIYLGSDTTIHGIAKDYGNKINDKCLLINDLTLLLESKAIRTKSRLVNALSELASEGLYKYSDWQKLAILKGKFSLIANITPQSYLYNRKSLLDNTFTGRCLVVYHELTEKEMTEANLHRDQRNSLKFQKCKELLTEKDIKVTDEDKIRINEYAKRWRILGAYTSSSSLFDMIKSVLTAYAILNNHTELGEDEYRFLNLLEPYIHRPFESMKLEILSHASQGRSIKDICLMFDKDYRKYQPYVSKVLREYRISGVLPKTKR